MVLLLFEVLLTTAKAIHQLYHSQPFFVQHTCCELKEISKYLPHHQSSQQIIQVCCEMVNKGIAVCIRRRIIAYIRFVSAVIYAV